jgi:inner membrane protein
MDAGTHALASFALARVALPGAPRATWAVVILAGTIADLDALSAISGPSAYLNWHRTYSHSLAASVVAGVVLSLVYVLLSRNPVQIRASRAALFGAILLAGWLHLAIDACQSEGVQLFWPFSERRIAADWLADIDPWILAILVLAIALPELLHLVSSEIGAKDKRPRGRTGAIIGLVAVVFYVGVRASLHSNALAAMQAWTYRGESPRRVGAFPESVSPLTWHGIVETESALHQVTVNADPGASFDPESGVTLYKPEPSPVLDQARDSAAAKKFLSIARFPKATVEKTADVYTVELRDLRYAAAGETRHEIAVLVDIDASGKVAEDALVWAREVHHR